MAWNDLTIPQRSQLMNLFRRNGVFSLSEMKRLYDLSSPSIPLVEDTFKRPFPTAPVYAGGGEKFSKNAKTKDGDKYIDIVRLRYLAAKQALEQEGTFTAEEINRLVPLIVTQNAVEAGWKMNVPGNNIGGMMTTNTNGSQTRRQYDSLTDYYRDWLSMMDRRFGDDTFGQGKGWRSAQDINDYARIINLEDQNVTTKEAWDNYRKTHPNSFLYAPQWDNGNLPYSSKLRGVSSRTNAYLDMVLDELKDTTTNGAIINYGLSDYLPIIQNTTQEQTPVAVPAVGIRPGGDYYTKLNNRDERRFGSWYNKYAEGQGLSVNPDDPRHGYDYRGLWKDSSVKERQAFLNALQDNHMPDTYKQPWHETFSDQSKYAKGIKGVGSWGEESFMPGYFNNIMQTQTPQVILDKLGIKYARGGNLYWPGGNIVNKIRERLYNNVEPQSYNDAFHRVFNGVVLNKNMRNTNVGSNPRDALWAKYLNIPEDKNKLKYNDLTESPYTPTVGREGTDYYRLELSDKTKNTIIEQASDLNFGEAKNARIIDSLGTHTISKGLDPRKGEYVSYYDKWKIAPFFGGKRDDQSFGIGTPVNIYDRIYLDDYYNVKPQIETDSFYGGYIQPAIINKEGGRIYIKKKNRGKFTALKKRTGKSASWFKAHGTPAQKKMAVFALNSRHWGHKKQHGGIIF